MRNSHDADTSDKSLSDLRVQAILTQAQLSKKSRVSIQTISVLENGYHVARFATVRRLAKAIGVTPQVVLAACKESRRRAGGTLVRR